MMNKYHGRDRVFDFAKFLAIGMVILWHLISWDEHYAGKSFLVNYIIGYNMPLFFLISGYFSRKMHETHDWRALLLRLISYIWPMLVFSILDVLFAMLCGKKINLVGFWLHDFFLCFWFFWCLGLCDISTFVVFCMPRKSGFYLFCMLCVLFIIVWLIPLGLYCYGSMVPFYWIGIFLLPYIYSRIDNQNMTWIGVCACGVYIVVSALEGDVRSNGMGFYWFKMPLNNFEWLGLGIMISRFFMGVLGSVGLVAILRICISHIKSLEKMSSLGQTTLGVYCLHRYMVSEDISRGFTGGGEVWLKVAYALGIFIVSHVFVILTRRLQFLDVLFWGPRRLFSRKSNADMQAN